VIRPLDRYAHWLEHMGRYPSARAEYARALTIAEAAGSRAARLVIDPLLGIARSYRLEATNGSEEEAAQYVDPFAQSSVGGLADRAGRGLNPDGEKALLLAQQTIDKLRPVDHEQRRCHGRTAENRAGRGEARALCAAPAERRAG